MKINKNLSFLNMFCSDLVLLIFFNTKYKILFFLLSIYIFCLILFHIVNLNRDIFYIIIFVSFFNDTIAYLSGKKIGGPPIIPSISPNKTIAGCIGSFVLSILTSSLLLKYIFNTELINNIFLGLFISMSVQAGDLFFSYLKRKSSMKHTGNILPGHGGILDRIDGILLGMPVGLLYVLILVFT